jgi:ABC-2 type transport system ATP-binding protein
MTGNDATDQRATGVAASAPGRPNASPAPDEARSADASPAPDRRGIPRKRIRAGSAGLGARDAREPDRGSPIRTRALTKAYGDLIAVDRLDLEVRAGEIFGLLGQNGAGKTTTILMLLGLSEPTSGEVRVVGFDPARDPLAVKRRVGYLPDAVGFYGNLTGRQNLRYTARLNGLPSGDSERRIAEVLELAGLRDRADDRSDTYSRGMLQRLGIADALLKDPEVLILDEPTTAIDPLGVVEILELLRTLAHERGITILLSSHLLNQVQSTCDRIGIFAAGRLIGSGTIVELGRRFGFPPDDLEVALDVPPEDTEAVEDILRSVPGILEVTMEHGIRDERAWMLRSDPVLDIEATLRGVLEAIGRRPIIRIGRRRIELDAIYRRAVEREAAEREAAERRPAPPAGPPEEGRPAA